MTIIDLGRTHSLRVCGTGVTGVGLGDGVPDLPRMISSTPLKLRDAWEPQDHVPVSFVMWLSGMPS